MRIVVPIVADSKLLLADDPVLLIKDALCTAAVFPPCIIAKYLVVIVAAALPGSFGREKVQSILLVGSCPRTQLDRPGPPNGDSIIESSSP